MKIKTYGQIALNINLIIIQMDVAITNIIHFLFLL